MVFQGSYERYKISDDIFGTKTPLLTFSRLIGYTGSEPLSSPWADNIDIALFN